MTSRSSVPVALGDRSYSIEIGTGLIAQAGTLIGAVAPTKRVLIVADETVAALYLQPLQAALAGAGFSAHATHVAAGESTKEFERLGGLLEKLLAQRPDRRTVLIALGGGVVGDLTGFAASILLRGVDFVQIPTTLLAQVDSSVGGKTAVNSRHGKNLIGSFHQPRLVLADTDTLATLPRRELLAGYAEVVKYGLLGDAPFFAWLEHNGAKMLAGDGNLRRHAIAHCCAAKARIVMADERETGERALLNLGHTFGHALERETGYGNELLHGEGVAIGMVLAFDLSAALGLCPAEDAARVRRHLQQAGLPVSPRGLGQRRIDAGQLIEHMRHDKKSRDGNLTFVLSRGIGQAFLTDTVGEADLRAVLQRALAA